MAGHQTPRMVVATVLTGIAAGMGGAVLTLLVHVVQHVTFGYSENSFLIGVGRASAERRVLALVVGGIVVGTGWWWHRRHVAPDDVSVNRALRTAPYRLPVLHTVFDAVLQIIAVGVGASLGREGAPRQAGAAFGGWLADRAGLDAVRRRTLLACGAGAGLAAVYDVPLGGAAFTLEILLVSISLVDVVPAVLTASIATVTAWSLLGDHLTYLIPRVRLDAPVVVWAVVLGPVAGLAGVAFVRLMAVARVRAPTGWRTVPAVVLAFSALGCVSILYPDLLGNGKGPAGLAFDGALTLGAAAALVLLKPATTALMLGSGAIGGLLTPALATGAALGAFTGRLWSLLWPGASLVEYAVIGAAALLAVTQRAPITAVLLTLEFVGTGQALLAPVLIAVALALSTAWVLDRETFSYGNAQSRPGPIESGQ